MTLGGRVLPRQRDLGGEHALRLEAGVDALQPREAGQQQPGGDQQHQRQRDFNDQQAGTKMTARSDGSWARCFQRFEDVDARGLHRG